MKMKALVGVLGDIRILFADFAPQLLDIDFWDRWRNSHDLLQFTDILNRPLQGRTTEADPECW